MDIGISTAEIIPPRAVPVSGIPRVKSSGGRIVPKKLRKNPHFKKIHPSK